MGPIVILIPIAIYLVLARWERRIKVRVTESERAEFHRTLDRLENFGPPAPVVDLAVEPSRSPLDRHSAPRTSAAA